MINKYLLIPLPLPLRDQLCIRIPVLEQPLVQLLADAFFLIIQLVHVPASLMRDLKDGPHGRVPGHVGRRCILGVFHLVAEDEQVRLDVAEALGRRLALRGVPDRGHNCGNLWALVFLRVKVVAARYV